MRNPLVISSQSLVMVSAEHSVASIAELVDINMEPVAFLILDISDWQAAYQQLQQIRGNTQPGIYLKPVLFHGVLEGVPRDILNAADGILHSPDTSLEQSLETWAAKFEPINSRIDKLMAVYSEGDSNIAFKVLRFMQTRDSAFKPVPTPQKLSGYIYPKLQPLFIKDDIGVMETLEFLESRKLIAGQFLSRSYGCTHCGCAFLNFFETCPDCGASDLYTEELIHHFKCAYVGEVSDYLQGSNMICPKCDRPLKHIGVDYDKTSVVYHCRSCSNVFQDPAVMTACYDCWRETAPENQVVRDIKTFTISSLGDNAARFGMDSLFQTILESRVNTTSFAVFKEFFRLEKARIHRYQVSTSCLAILRIDGIERIYGQLGKRSQEVFVELSEAFRAGIRNSDVFSIRDETIFLTLLTETSEEHAVTAMTRLEKRIASLLESNLKMDFNVDFKIMPLAASIDLEGCIEDFLQSHAA